ncbi:MAG TPA: hypothetical protein DIV79_09110 [Opitutae bacterium]|nr:hypothetical protein [Opitutaceae bacterium]HCR30161.1 hypothetical protein [Opitutae bacterium]
MTIQEMEKETEDPHPLKRFILRIAIPFAIAAIIIAIMQFVLTVWFNRENVRPSPKEESSGSAAVSILETVKPIQLDFQ